MTDVIENTEIEAPNPPVEGAPEQPEETKPAKAKAEPRPCLCSTFLLLDPQEPDAEFTTECDATTLRNFAQGHDARLVSFLVSGQLDGYSIHQQKDGVRVSFDGAGHAAASISEHLGVKADKAIENAGAKRAAKEEKAKARAAQKEARAQERAAAKEAAAKEREAKAEARKAEKAKAPREVGAQVAPGSQEGDRPVVDVNAPVAKRQEDGTALVLIKVGRHTTEAVLSADGATVRYLDKEGVEQERETDTVRMLSRFED